MDCRWSSFFPVELELALPVLPVSGARWRESSSPGNHLSFESHLPLTELFGPEDPSSTGNPLRGAFVVVWRERLWWGDLAMG